MSLAPALAALACCVPLAACATGSQQKAGLVQSSPGVTMTTPELRVRVSIFADDFVATVEAAADSIIEQADDPTIRRDALVWKANAIPALQQTLFVSDPLAAMIDGWTFSAQMDEFFRGGAGSDLFGAWQSIATRASGHLLQSAEQIARLATTDQGFANGTAFVSGWVHDHRFETLLFARQPTNQAFADALGYGARGGLAGVADINESVTVLSNRISIYAATLPKQARWQAELLLLEVKDEPQTQLFLDDVASLQRDVELIESQFGDIRDVIVDVDGILTGQRLAAFQQMNDEMTGLIERLAEQRGAIMALLDSGRVAVSNDVSAQRIAAMAELDSIVQRAVEEALNGSEGVIDHLFLRTVQLLAGLAVIAIVGIAVFRRRTRTP